MPSKPVLRKNSV